MKDPDLSPGLYHQDYPQTVGEEISNSISHGVGFLAAVAITPILILKAHGAAAIVGVSIFGATMMMLYLASTLYHAFPHSRTKQVFKLFDHCAIFLLIAGTYSPFTLTVLYGAWGWSLFGVTWALAAAGIVLKSVRDVKSDKLSTALYLGMGWLAVVAAKPLYDALPFWGLFWLMGGGVMYSAGVLFFVYDHRLKYAHFVWHLFVLAGTACHVIALMGFAL
ncbi:MAG: hemolysin III family protein [Cytophagales bacterium]|jgi:hemolysin III|nr:hemolysin III family protein [Bacteroidota bacterium]MBS1981081.1 hemolysin III family protein [Bacteroidota bacterium]WHZ08445.1 MAG: hemolysin III family protein [Cytophagales bacterium]